jgi:type II restriction enzyme
MKTGFSEAPAQFMSASQSARVVTESWAARNMFCPSCGHDHLQRFRANRPVADFFCGRCGDEYELKSQSKAFGKRVADGAYEKKIERLQAENAPNLILLQYDRGRKRVENLRIVPNFFFVPQAIERRRPLGPDARRAGWVGSNILLDRIPASGQIGVIHSGNIRDKSVVMREWDRLRFVERRVGDARGWLLEVMNCVERIGLLDFTLADVYAFETELASIFPRNNNVRPKIRQQLQVLRDGGFLEFLGQGHYRLIGPS